MGCHFLLKKQQWDSLVCQCYLGIEPGFLASCQPLSVSSGQLPGSVHCQINFRARGGPSAGGQGVFQNRVDPSAAKTRHGGA